MQKVYCDGPLLHAVQMNRLFKDSKEFVDMPMKFPPDVVLKHFEDQKPITKEELTKFVQDNFTATGSEFHQSNLSDYNPDLPREFDIQRLEKIHEFILAIHQTWPQLARETKETTEEIYSTFLPLKYPVIIPGGRFRECYYWDVLWIVHGLLLSDMLDTSIGMVENLMHWVDLYGHVPNGGRLYYIERSQPPVLSEMVMEIVYFILKPKLEAAFQSRDVFSGFTLPLYHGKLECSTLIEEAQDPELKDFVVRALASLKKEYKYWMDNDCCDHTCSVESNGQQYTLNIYASEVDLPRPESYREDLETYSQSAPPYQSTVFQNVRAAAESGWDFSSRFFVDDLASSITDKVIPVDLNVILYRMEINIACLHLLLGDRSGYMEFQAYATRRKEAINQLLYHEESSSWRDWLVTENAQSDNVSCSNYLPLWAHIQSKDKEEAIIQSLADSGLLQRGGLQTSTKVTCEQWDSPNAWAPIQQMIVFGLYFGVGSKSARALANKIASGFVTSVLETWKTDKVFYEKYNAFESKEAGAGGEYEVQVGFGWTNGVVLQFLAAIETLEFL